MRWITVALVFLLSGFLINGTESDEDDNYPTYITEGIFVDPEGFTRRFLDDGWNLYANIPRTDKPYSFLAWSRNSVHIVNVMQFSFATSQELSDAFSNVQFAESFFPTGRENTLECHLSQVTLYEFQGTLDNEPFRSYMYRWQSDANTLWQVSYWSIESEAHLLQAYIDDFQPDLTSCENDS